MKSVTKSVSLLIGTSPPTERIITHKYDTCLVKENHIYVLSQYVMAISAMKLNSERRQMIFFSSKREMIPIEHRSDVMACSYLSKVQFAMKEKGRKERPVRLPG
jgi:hypothetical protein